MDIRCIGVMLARVFNSAVIGFGLGLVAGYLLFGRIMGQWIQVDYLMPAKHPLDQWGQSVVGISEIRMKIIICGLIFAVIGGVGGYLYDVAVSNKSREQ